MGTWTQVDELSLGTQEQDRVLRKWGRLEFSFGCPDKKSLEGPRKGLLSRELDR